MDADIAGLVSFEAAVFAPRRLGLQVTQVAHPMPAKAAVEPQASDIRVQELPHHPSRSSSETSNALHSAWATAMIGSLILPKTGN